MSDDPVDDLVGFVADQTALNERLAAELERLGKGVEKIAAKYGADHPTVADALHKLLRGRE